MACFSHSRLNMPITLLRRASAMSTMARGPLLESSSLRVMTTGAT